MSVSRIPLKSLCVANRGEIAQRVLATATRMGIQTSMLYTDADSALPAALASKTNNLCLGPSSGYLDIDKIISTAKNVGCDSIHPGYGFLSENAEFARRVQSAGLTFIGPPPSAMESMGSKSRSKEIMESANVPVVPGYHGKNQDPEFLAGQADAIGYPVLIKAVLGGGGKGMRIVESADDFQSQLASAKSEAKSSFGDERVLIERYIKTPRHVEVQVFADKYGNVVALGERDCSVQRRHQKILEESPAPGLDEGTRQSLWQKARDAAKVVGYEGAGTVEFIFDNDSGEFFFMEMNTRLQVEHAVSEAVTGTDLVEWQLLVAAGFPLPLKQEDIKLNGHAIEARLYCENPDKGFLPSSGKIIHLRKPTTGTPRLDFTFEQGSVVSPLYDPMIGKLVVHGENRTEALLKLHMALSELEIVGPETNIDFVKRILVNPGFSGENPPDLETGFIEKHKNEVFNTSEISQNPLVADVYAQAAIGRYLQLSQKQGPLSDAFARLLNPGWVRQQVRTFSFKDIYDERPDAPLVETVVTQLDHSRFHVAVDGKSFGSVEASAKFAHDPATSSFKLFTRWSNRQQDVNFVFDNATSRVHMFYKGEHQILEVVKPSWVTKALGQSEDGNTSVVSPMSCKISKVLVSPGDAVEKDQPLVVIESMKMETTIRSPIPGRAVVKSIPHKIGDVVDQGVHLIEFEDLEPEKAEDK